MLNHVINRKTSQIDHAVLSQFKVLTLENGKLNHILFLKIMTNINGIWILLAQLQIKQWELTDLLQNNDPNFFYVNQKLHGRHNLRSQLTSFLSCCSKNKYYPTLLKIINGYTFIFVLAFFSCLIFRKVQRTASVAKRIMLSPSDAKLNHVFCQ